MSAQVPGQAKLPSPPSGWSRLFQWHTLAVLLIIIGAVMITLYGLRSLRSFREFQYIRAAGLDRGTARIEAIRPWMTVRYIGVAYAVPEEFIFAQLEIPYNRRNSNEIWGRLNEEYAMGQSPNGDYPQIVDRVAQAIRDYRANPVPTGLRQIRPWMTIRYIASSTGVPESYLFEQLGLDEARAAQIDAAVRPLDQLVAGSGGYPFRHFLFFSISGEATWLLLYGGLGYAFSDQWETISELISNFGGVLLGALLLVVGVVVLIRSMRRSPTRAPELAAQPAAESVMPE